MDTIEIKPFPFKAVVFDMDGVIVDSEYFYLDALHRYAAEYGIPMTEEEMKRTVGASHQDFCRWGIDWLSRIGIEATGEQAIAHYRAWEQRNPPHFDELLNPGVVETIGVLRDRGVRVALASSSPRREIDNVLAQCGLASAFELIVSGEQFVESKPNPEIYLYSAEHLGLDPSECCCIEDSIPGITAGKAAGYTVFAKREERFGYSQDAADMIIDQVSDILTEAYEVER